MTDNESKAVMQRERMRLGQVRKSFAAGVEQLSAGNAVELEFLAVCVDYIKASMDRLHAQDQRIHDILHPHLKADDAQGHAILENLNMRLAKSREALVKLVNARDSYRAMPTTNTAHFKTTVDAFMDVYFNILLKGQHSTLEMQSKVFDHMTWNTVAGVTQDSRVTEASLFAAVKKYAPLGADPESFKGTRPVA
jgi:hypothetical protein